MKAPHVLFQHVVCQPTYSRPVQSKFTASSPSFWQRLLERFFTIDSQLQVTQKRDRLGNEYYQIYDQFSGQTKTFSSQQETLIWLDQKRF